MPQCNVATGKQRGPAQGGLIWGQGERAPGVPTTIGCRPAIQPLFAYASIPAQPTPVIEGSGLKKLQKK